MNELTFAKNEEPSPIIYEFDTNTEPEHDPPGGCRRGMTFETMIKSRAASLKNWLEKVEIAKKG